MRLDLYEYEASEAGGDDGAIGETVAAPEPAGETTTATETEQTAPAFTPEQIAALRENPEFRDFLAEEAQTVADARLRTLAEQYGQAQPPATDGAPFDANEYLNPFGEGYGQNLLTLFQQNNQLLLSQVKEIISPLSQQHEAEAASKQDELLKDAIGDAVTRTGDLEASGEANDRIMRDVRDRYFPEFAQRYGETNRAAELAIDKAVQAERAYQQTVGEAAVTRYKNRLETLGGTHGEPGTGASGVETFSDKPLSVRELAFKHGGRATTIS